MKKEYEEIITKCHHIWGQISGYQKLPEDFIREFQDKINWNIISEYQTLSEDFIREFQDKVNWDIISVSQNLSEDFIREFKDKVNWRWISAYQILSEDFIREFKNKVYDKFIKKTGLYKIIEKGLYDKEAEVMYEENLNCGGSSRIASNPASTSKDCNYLNISTTSIDCFKKENKRDYKNH